MAPLLPQDRPWNQSEGTNTNRQPFRQRQLKIQVTVISVYITDIYQTPESFGKVDQIGKI